MVDKGQGRPASCMYVQSVSEDQSGMRIGMGMGVVDMDMEAGVGEGCAPAASARSTGGGRLPDPIEALSVDVDACMRLSMRDGRIL